MAKTAPPILIGYQRVSTDDQKLELQHDALIGAGVEPDRIYQDKLSGAKSDRPVFKLRLVQHMKFIPLSSRSLR